jgi:hypothetical protein
MTTGGYQGERTGVRMQNASGGYADSGGAVQRDDDPAVSYEGAVPGTPVLSRSGTEIGTLEHVLEVPELGLFDGIVIATDWGLRFIGADQIKVITIRHIRCRIDDAEAARLPPPDGSPVYRVNVLEEIGDSLHALLGRRSHPPHGPGEEPTVQCGPGWSAPAGGAARSSAGGGCHCQPAAPPGLPGTGTSACPVTGQPSGVQAIGRTCTQRHHCRRRRRSGTPGPSGCRPGIHTPSPGRSCPDRRPGPPCRPRSSCPCPADRRRGR